MGKTGLISMVAVLLAGVLVWSTPGFADTYVGGHLTEDTVWEKAGSPYMLSESLRIDQGATLTIQPGVVVYGNDDEYKRYGIYVEGALIAEGTEEERIVFDRGPGWQWLGIRFCDSSDDNKCILSFCNIVNTNSAIICWDSAPTISHCLIESEGGGIDLYGTPDIVPVITHNVIKNCARGIFTLGPSPIIEYNEIIGIGPGICITKDAKPVIHHNNILESGVCTDSPGPIDARYNWWGTADEDKIRRWVTGNIDYSFWLSAPVDTAPVMPATWGQIKSLFR